MNLKFIAANSVIFIALIGIFSNSYAVNDGFPPGGYPNSYAPNLNAGEAELMAHNFRATSAANQCDTWFNNCAATARNIDPHDPASVTEACRKKRSWCIYWAAKGIYQQ